MYFKIVFSLIYAHYVLYFGILIIHRNENTLFLYRTYLFGYVSTVWTSRTSIGQWYICTNIIYVYRQKLNIVYEFCWSEIMKYR